MTGIKKRIVFVAMQGSSTLFDCVAWLQARCANDSRRPATGHGPWRRQNRIGEQL